MKAMTEINVTKFWDRFDQVRTDSLETICNRAGVSHNTIRGLRTHNKLPNLVDTIVLADYLNVTLDWLVLGKVADEKNADISKVLKAYIDTDEQTKYVIRKLLNLI